jgi:hypothetical protein
VTLRPQHDSQDRKIRKDHGATVSAFYASNVEYYLDDKQQQPFIHVLALPVDSSSVFVRFITGTGS